MEVKYKKQTDTITDERLTIDVAVLYQETTEIRQMCKDHITNLDDIDITEDAFRKMFYPHSENFCIDTNYINSNEELKKKVSFLPEYRSVNGKKFYLLEQILTNLETDLCVPRTCFTIDSRVELANEITGIKTLGDLNVNSVLSSLTWYVQGMIQPLIISIPVDSNRSESTGDDSINRNKGKTDQIKDFI
jgi:hypothetical protein